MFNRQKWNWNENKNGFRAVLWGWIQKLFYGFFIFLSYLPTLFCRFFPTSHAPFCHELKMLSMYNFSISLSLRLFFLSSTVVVSDSRKNVSKHPTRATAMRGGILNISVQFSALLFYYSLFICRCLSLSQVKKLISSNLMNLPFRQL